MYLHSRSSRHFHFLGFSYTPMCPIIADGLHSADGSRIAFFSRRDSNWEIYVMNADGSGETRLTTNSAHEVDPSWSPDGTRIVFTSSRDMNFEIYVMNADGTVQTNLTKYPEAADSRASWSPDGSRIAF